MEDRDKLPLRRVEPSLTAFNEVAIPHHLDLLRQHHQNMLKAKRSESWTAVSVEQTRARRVARQMRCLLGELAALRSRVAVKDLPRFDALTHVARLRTSQAIQQYLEDAPPPTTDSTNPESLRPETTAELDTSPVRSDTNNLQSEALPPVVPLQIQLRVEEDLESTLRDREAALSGWTELRQEVEELHDTWLTMQRLAEAQGHKTTEVESRVQETSDNVATGTADLRRAEALKRSAWALGSVGAGVGALIGGPAGLFLGAKAGAAAGLAGAAAGLVIVRAVSSRRARQTDPEPNSRHPHDE